MMKIHQAVSCLASCLLVAIAAAHEGARAEAATGRIITLDEAIVEVEDFILEEDDTLLISEDRWIKAERAIILRGTVRVELPEDAAAGAWAPHMRLSAGERIVILGPMIFGPGRDGQEPGSMGGVGASLWMRAPLVAVGVPELAMGDGGRGGAGVEGGGGGIFELNGWLLPFHDDGLNIVGGRGGDGGDGMPGTALHPRGHRGGDGGSGAMVMQYGPNMTCRAHELEGFLTRAVGSDPALDPFVRGPHRRLPTSCSAVGGRGGHGGNGGAPYATLDPLKAAGGRGGDGGGGGYAAAPWGLPGSTVTPDDAPPPGTSWTGGIGSDAASAYGGRGGDGGDAGPGLSNFFFASLMGGNGGGGGRAVGGQGGDAGHVDPPARYVGVATGRPGRGGHAVAGSGGRAGTGHHGANGGNGGHATAGQSGS